MLTSAGCAARRARLWNSLPEPCEALLITSPESLVYFANFAPSPFVFRTVESAAALVLLPDRSILIGDNLLNAFLDRSFVDEVVSLQWYTGKKSAPPRRRRIEQAAAERLPTGTGCRLGIESFGHGSREPGQVVVLDPLIRSMRRNKDADELAVIR